jgi:hypothetical protein
MNASFHTLCCSVGAIAKGIAAGRVARLRPSAMFQVMRHNRATHTDARMSAAIWTRRRARAGGCGR